MIGNGKSASETYARLCVWIILSPFEVILLHSPDVSWEDVLGTWKPHITLIGS